MYYLFAILLVCWTILLFTFKKKKSNYEILLTLGKGYLFLEGVLLGDIG